MLERVAKKKSEFAKRFSGFGRRFGPVSENEEVIFDGGEDAKGLAAEAVRLLHL